MITAQKLDYKIRCYEPGDEDAVLRLLELCLPSAASRWDSPALWRWKHQQNPFGQSYVLVAEADDGAIVGVRALMRWKFSNPTGAIGAVRPVDTATHPSFRRFGIFARLTKQAMADIQAEGVSLVFNTPNTMSLPGYIKMGWSPIGTVRPLVKLVNPIKAVAKMATAKARSGQERPSPAVNSLDPLAESMSVGRLLGHTGLDTLLQQDAALNTNQLCTEKSAGYLKWRYQDQVSFTYLALLAEKAAHPAGQLPGELDGELDGSIIVRPYQANGLRGLIIEELLLASPEPKVVARLLGEAVRVFNADVLTAYFNPASVQHTLLKSNGFRRDLRKKVNVVMRELNPSPGPNPQLAQTWGLSMGDLEFL